MLTRCAAAALLALLLLPVHGWAAAPKNVLIVRGESPDLPGITVLVDSVESSIRRNTTAPVDFYVELVDTGHFDIGTYEERLAALLAEKYADIPLDLVVTLSEPAAQFVLRERASLFPRTPLLLGLVDPHMAGTARPRRSASLRSCRWRSSSASRRRRLRRPSAS